MASQLAFEANAASAGLLRSDRGGRQHWPLAFLALLPLTFGLFVLRRYDALANPQFWAEDGKILFAGQLVHGGLLWLFKPYRGYLILNTKLLAALAAIFSPTNEPLVYNLIAICIASTACSLFVLPGYRYLVRSDLLRFAACLGVTAALYTDSLINNLSNSQWYMALIALLILFKDPARKPRGWETAFCTIVTLLSALSNPVLVITVPVCIWNLAKNRNRSVSAGLLLGIAIQIVVFLVTPRDPTEPIPPIPTVSGLAIGTVIGIIYKVVIVSTLGWRFTLQLADTGPAWCFYAALIATSVWLVFLLIRLSKSKRMQVVTSIYLAVASIVLPMRGRGMFQAYQSVVHLKDNRGEQYFFLAGAISLFLLALTLDQIFRDRRVWLKTIVFAGVIFGGIRGNFYVANFLDFKWPLYADKVTQWESARADSVVLSGLMLPENPRGWFIPLPPTFAAFTIEGFPDHLVATAEQKRGKPIVIEHWRVHQNGGIEFLDLPALFSPNAEYVIHADVHSDGPIRVALVAHGSMSSNQVFETAPQLINGRGELVETVHTDSTEKLCIHIVGGSSARTNFDRITFEESN